MNSKTAGRSIMPGLKPLVMALGLIVSSTAWSLPLSLADVGGIDELVASDVLSSSGEGTEEAWVQTVLGDNNIQLEWKIDGGFDWNALADQPGVFAQELTTDPSYFLVKIGVGKKDQSTVDTHFLFRNIGDLAYAVIDLGDFDYSKMNIGRVSHISEFNGDTAEVPEPATLSMMGLGLVLLGLRGRRRQS